MTFNESSYAPSVKYGRRDGLLLLLLRQLLLLNVNDDHHGNSLNRVVTLADFIAALKDRNRRRWRRRTERPSNGPSIADCASFNLFPIDDDDDDDDVTTSKDLPALLFSLLVFVLLRVMRCRVVQFPLAGGNCKEKTFEM